MSRRIRKAGGDVQAVSIPSNERRRVGARNALKPTRQEEDQLGVGHMCSPVDRRNFS